MRARFSSTVLAIALLGAALAGCKSVEAPKVPGITPYRMVIQQGNFISDDMVAQLKPGMTKEQVRFVLGTPLVTDIFHADRWDYVFFREMPNGKREQRNLSVVFQDNKLARVIGDLLPDPNTPKPAPVAKPEPKPEAEPKPAAAEAKPPAEPAKPAPAQAGESWEPTKQNWDSAPQAEPEKPAAEPEAKAEAPKPEPAKEEAQKPAEEKKERGFFGRMLEKIGL